MGTAGTTAAPTASARIAKPRLRARFRDSARLRLTPYFLVLALPLGIGVWAFGSYAAGNARQRTDSQLRASLAAAALGYRRELAGAEVAARTIARRPAIQRAVSG